MSLTSRTHADALIERILFLDSLPNLQDLHKLKVGENVPEMFQCDLAVETNNRGMLQEAVAHCESVRDYVSRQILDSILEDTEEHIDWIETQIELVRTVGLENYLAEKMGEDEG